MVISYIDIASMVSKPIYRYIPPGSEDIFRYTGEKTAHNRRENNLCKKILFVTHSQYSRQTSIELRGIEESAFHEGEVPCTGEDQAIQHRNAQELARLA